LKKKEFKEGDKVLLYNLRFKTFGKGKLQSKWEGPYIVHSVLSNGAVIIMDVKGDQFMVNGQRLKVYYEPCVVPLHRIDVFTMEEEPEHLAYDVKQGGDFVNSFSFIFLEFIAKFTRPSFSHGLKMRNKRDSRKTGPHRPANRGRPAGSVRPAQGALAAVRPRFPLGRAFSTAFFG
jgi:hypothetical protein